MTVAIRDWVLWWADVLGGMLAWRSNALEPYGDVLSVSSNGIVLSTAQAGLEGETLTLDEISSRLLTKRALPNEYNKSLTIKIDKHRAIIRKVAAMSLPTSRHHMSAILDMETSTPFTTADSYALLVSAESGGEGAYYAIVKRSVLDPLLKVLDQAQIKVTAIHFEHRGQLFKLKSASKTGLMQRPLNLLERATIGALATCGIFFAMTLVHHAYQFDDASNKLEQSMMQLNLDAKAVRTELDKRSARVAELQALRKSIEDRKPAIVIWEEIARALPDSSFLTDMTVTEGKVSIAGYSKAAASIIVALEGSNLFEEVSFTAPVVKVPGRTDDRFAIDLKVSVK